MGHSSNRGLGSRTGLPLNPDPVSHLGQAAEISLNQFSSSVKWDSHLPCRSFVKNTDHICNLATWVTVSTE